MRQMYNGMVHVLDNSRGGGLFITESDGVLSGTVIVKQSKYDVQNNKLIIETRYAELVESVERMLSINLAPGDSLRGKIVVKQQVIPVIEGEKDMYLLKDNKGKIITTEAGEPVYIRSFYTEDPKEYDEIIISYLP